MAVLMQWNLNRGFLDYINQVESELLDRLIPRLVEVYETHNDWSWLRDQPREWRRLIGEGEFSKGHHKRPPPPPAEEDRRLRQREQRPHRRPRPPPPDPLHIGQRVTLYDADGLTIIGEAVFSNQAKPIEIDDNVVGWLGIEKLRRIRAVRDINFLQQQARSFFFIAALLLLLATLLAFLLTHHWVRPLQQATRAMRKLAEGHFHTRVAVNGHDEIADLTRDVNTLARILADNQQAQQRWIADISHELRTPITVVQGELEAIEDGVRSLDKVALRSLQNEITRLSVLINDLHELSLADQGALSYQMQSINLADLISQTIDSFKIRIQQHQLELQVSEPLPDLPVKGDSDRLLQLFSNLFENAIRYTDPGGCIGLQVALSEHFINITFADSPPGVAAEQCPYLFDRLYRVESSRSRHHGGSGLGLAICKSIVEAHGGTIEAKPSHLGGLAIIIALPLRGHA